MTYQTLRRRKCKQKPWNEQDFSETNERQKGEEKGKKREGEKEEGNEKGREGIY